MRTKNIAIVALFLGSSVFGVASIAAEKSAEDHATACVQKHHSEAPEWVDCVASHCSEEGSCTDEASAITAAKACHEKHPGELEKLLAACYKHGH